MIEEGGVVCVVAPSLDKTISLSYGAVVRTWCVRMCGSLPNLY